MRVGLDATPLLGRRTGIGRYTEHLAAALAARGDTDVVATAFTVRGSAALRDAVPSGVAVRTRPAPARALQQAWLRTSVPWVELIGGRTDVFHATNFVLPPLRRARGVVTVHDLAFLGGTVDAASERYRALVPRSVARARVVLTPSEAVRQQVLATYPVEPAAVRVTPLGVQDVWGRASPDPALAARLGLPERYVLAVGTLEPRKGLQTLVDAVRTLTPQPPLVLVGGDGWGPALRDLTDVRLPGYLDAADLRSVVAGAGVLAFPSLDEGFGLPPLEAFACGVPVVCSDLPVTREVLGDHARFVPVGDVEALAHAVATTLADGGPTTAQQRRTHAAGFTWERTAALTREAYVAALA